MEVFWQELTSGLPDQKQLAQSVIRLLAAVVLGGIIGIQRERANKPAGLRTHILVTLGTCLIVLACTAFGMNSDGLSRVIQGIVTGIGFVGAGSILKINEDRDVQGLTTATSVWIAAGIGVAVGLGTLGLAIIGTAVALIVLAFVGSIEFRMHARRHKNVN